METTTGRRAERPSRFQLPNLVIGLVVGALVTGGLIPLVGADHKAPLSGPPSFLTNGDQAGGPASAVSAYSGSGVGPSGVGSGGTQVTSAANRNGGPSGRGALADGSGGAAAALTEPRRASDIGITADTIKIGSYIVDCQECAALGSPLPSADWEEQAYHVIVDDMNAHGGVAGRKIELHTARIEPVRDAVNGGGTERAACLELTENQKVFAIAGGGFINNTCIYTEHKVPLITYDDPSDDPKDFNDSGGRIWKTSPSGARALYDFAHQIGPQNLLQKDTKWGFVYTDWAPEKSKVEDVFLPEIKKLGYNPTHISKLPSSDQASTAVAIQQEVNTTKSAGITHVVFGTNNTIVQSWLRDAEQNNYHPQYIVSQFTNPNDGQGQAAAGAGNWNGAIAMSTWNNITLPQFTQYPEGKKCMDIFNRTPNHPAQPSLDIIFCFLLDMFKNAGDRAGVNPTRDSLVKALATTGEFSNPLLENGIGSFGGSTPFGPVKWSAAEYVRKKVWTTPCRYDTSKKACYEDAGPPVRMLA